MGYTMPTYRELQERLNKIEETGTWGPDVDEAWSGEPEDDFDDGVKECPRCNGQGEYPPGSSNECKECQGEGVILQSEKDPNYKNPHQYVIHELEDIKDQMEELVQMASNIVRQLGNDSLTHTMDRGVLAHIKMALSNDHDFLGKNMNTFQDIIDQLQDPHRRR